LLPPLREGTASAHDERRPRMGGQANSKSISGRGRADGATLLARIERMEQRLQDVAASHAAQLQSIEARLHGCLALSLGSAVALAAALAARRRRLAAPPHRSSASSPLPGPQNAAPLPGPQNAATSPVDVPPSMTPAVPQGDSVSSPTRLLVETEPQLGTPCARRPCVHPRHLRPDT